MADKTGIEWTDATLNFVTGCSRVSPGCDNCYMFAQWPRLKGMKVNGYQGDPDKPVLNGERLDIPYRWKRPRRIFVNSMSDTFHRDVPYSFIDMMFQSMALNARHTYQVLTKRPGIAAHWWETRGAEQYDGEWPAHIWLGTSVESQKYQPRMRVLSRIPAPIRFVSIEPMLGPVELGLDYVDKTAQNWVWHKEKDCFPTLLERSVCYRKYVCDRDIIYKGPPVSWVIVGGESGRKPRPIDPDWVRAIRDECAKHDVPFFFKQWGDERDKPNDEPDGPKGGNTLDGKQHLEFPA